MISACHRVLATPELLEAILLQLHSLNHLLLAQRISRLFHTTITTTKSLQNALFFPSPSSSFPSPPAASTWTINPLLREYFQPFFIIDHNKTEWFGYGVLNILDWAGIEENGERKSDRESMRKREAMLFEGASWRRMSVVSVHVGEVEVRATSHGMGGDWVQKAVVRFDGGMGEGGGMSEGDGDAGSKAGYLSMGALYDLVESYLAACQGSYPRFKVSYLESSDDDAPRVVLDLGMTVQCCPESPGEMARLKSKGAVFNALGALNRFEDDKEVKDLDMGDVNEAREKRKSVLTKERGGIEEWEWAEWLRMRQGMGSLGSDVRG